MPEVKALDIDDCCYMFETLEELVDMLKEDDYECILTIRKKRKIRRLGVKL
ncbi:hypothetical protein HYH39_06300 [Clostridium botulinum]|nr:hypothetical protein [Clostridium botulinum]MBY6802815.1 hypothetical protein [Clostridium botulinum]MBY6812934.1 hypothetical protein [Clostridium botulinum]MBY6818939.1 hypothetical protein [Clostridium botulinum]MBY6851733.1 hypothetical protein [Clostridium botulinum]